MPRRRHASTDRGLVGSRLPLPEGSAWFKLMRCFCKRFWKRLCRLYLPIEPVCISLSKSRVPVQAALAQGICAGCGVLTRSTLSLLLICSANLSQASAGCITSAEILQSHPSLTWTGESCRHLLLMGVPCDLRIPMTAYKLRDNAEIGACCMQCILALAGRSSPAALSMTSAMVTLLLSPRVASACIQNQLVDFLRYHRRVYNMQLKAIAVCIRAVGVPTLARCRSVSHSNADRTLTPP